MPLDGAPNLGNAAHLAHPRTEPVPLKPRPHPAALPHGDIEEILPGIHFVRGTVAMGMGMRFSRAMTIIQEGDRVVLVNSVRLDDAGLAALDRLGRVTDVIRLAGFHGMDDPFYKERYGAKMWAMAGQRYYAGFDSKVPDTYFEADVLADATTPLPLEGARVHLFGSDPEEGLLLLERHGGIAIAGDSLQNWGKPDASFSFMGTLVMRMMGFLAPCNVGPGWYKQAKPPKAGLRAVLDLPFTRVIPAHGTPVLESAKEQFRPAIERASA
jgi:hypothetical protein